MESLKRKQQEQEKAMRSQQKDWQRHGQTIERGHRLFVELMDKGGSTRLWTRDDFKDFRVYYDAVDSEFTNEISQRYGELSQNLYLLALLEHMGKSDKEIIAMMDLTIGALRTTRTRLNQKRKD